MRERMRVWSSLRMHAHLGIWCQLSEALRHDGVRQGATRVVTSTQYFCESLRKESPQKVRRRSAEGPQKVRTHTGSEEGEGCTW